MGRLGTDPIGALTPVGPAVESAVSTVARLAARQGVRITTHLPPDLAPAAVERVALRQILLNALTFVLAHGSKGVVEISTRPDEALLQLSIEYRGAMPLHTSPLAEDDQRLALARRLIEMCRGRMQIEQGEHFAIRFALPVRKAPTILVIDDNQDLIDLFRRYLNSSAYRVLSATSGAEGLRLAEEARPQAITLDVMMPSQDGWEILQALQTQPATRDIPVIVCTILRERELALSLGATDFVAKPATQEMLLAAIARCLLGQQNATHPDQT